MTINAVPRYYADGTVYVGEWRNGRSSGHGVMVFSKNSQYKGLWRQGRFHGAGVFSSESGDVFAGEWRAGLLLRCAAQHKKRKVKVALLCNWSQCLRLSSAIGSVLQSRCLRGRRDASQRKMRKTREMRGKDVLL